MVQRKTVTTATWVLALGTLGVLAAGCGGSGAESYSQAVKTAPGDSDVAPDFTLSDLEGNTFKLSDTSGRVRLIDFWATWCAPCREEIPMLKELEQAYAEQGLTVVGISDEDSEVVGEFVAEQGIGYTNLLDPGDVAEDYLVVGLPTAFLIGRDGQILKRYTGPKPRKVLEADIREALALPPQT